METLGYETVKTSELKPHPLAEKIYGKELCEAVFESIKDIGIGTPPKVKEDRTIINGHNRWRSAKKLNIETLEVQIVSFDDKQEEKQMILEDNITREETFSIKMKKAEEWLEIEEEKAMKRRKSGGIPNNHRESLPEGSTEVRKLSSGKTLHLEDVSGKQKLENTGRAKEKVAKKLGGWSRRKFDMAWDIWQKSKEGDKQAKDLVDSIEKGKSINRAHNELKKAEERRKVKHKEKPSKGDIFDVDFTIEERANLHNEEFPNLSEVWTYEGELVGFWFLGGGSPGYLYGRYPSNYKDRLMAMFPKRPRVLHLFSGELETEDENVWTYDIRPEANADISDNALNVADHFDECFLTHIFIDPPYSRKATEKYNKISKVDIEHLDEGDRDNIISECYKVLKYNGFVCYLDWHVPKYSKEWRRRGMIGVLQYIGQRTRTCLILQKKKPASLKEKH